MRPRDKHPRPLSLFPFFLHNELSDRGEGCAVVLVTEYRLEYDARAREYKIRSTRSPLCPGCGCLLSGYDTRARKIIDSDGETYTFRLRRLRCPRCRALHLEIPDLIRPHKHYSAETIRQALQDGSSCPADDSTIRRWKK